MKTPRIAKTTRPLHIAPVETRLPAHPSRAAFGGMSDPTRATSEAIALVTTHGPHRSIKGIAEALRRLGPEYADAAEAMEKVARASPVGFIRPD